MHEGNTSECAIPLGVHYENWLALRMRSTALVLSLILCLLGGCFTTQIQTGQQRSFAPTESDRQWFTLGGLVQLSGAAGEECKEGISWAESGQKTTDVLITIGMTVAGTLLASAACSLPENATDDEEAAYALCQAGIAGVFPFLFASRTVEYQCKGTVNPPGVQVPTLSPIPGAAPGQQ